jgi:hypothetical protein
MWISSFRLRDLSGSGCDHARTAYFRASSIFTNSQTAQPTNASAAQAATNCNKKILSGGIAERKDADNCEWRDKESGRYEGA